MFRSCAASCHRDSGRQPLPPPDPFHPPITDRPACLAQQGSNLTIAVAAVLAGQFDHVGRQPSGILHRRLLAVVRDDEVCRRLMTVPGVGPVVALTYRVTVDVPARFRNSKAVGAVFGLTPSKHQSGESDRTGGISRCGDEIMRAMLYEAAQILLVRSTKWSWLKAWAMKIARRRGGEEGDRRPGASTGPDHAPHLD